MFTGIVRHLGRVAAVSKSSEKLALSVEAGPLAEDARIGDSICVSGVCLTVTAKSPKALSFDVIGETLSRTTLGKLQRGDSANLEPSLRPSDRLGGHFVTGHVDGIATVAERVDAPGEVRLTFQAEPALTRMMIPKGSVAVDGVSLTLTEVSEERFGVALIPHTLSQTTLGAIQTGDRVNIETDLLGKWVVKALGLGKGDSPLNNTEGTVPFSADPISEQFLREHGFA